MCSISFIYVWINFIHICMRFLALAAEAFKKLCLIWAELQWSFTCGHFKCQWLELLSVPLDLVFAFKFFIQRGNLTKRYWMDWTKANSITVYKIWMKEGNGPLNYSIITLYFWTTFKVHPIKTWDINFLGLYLFNINLWLFPD